MPSRSQPSATFRRSGKRVWAGVSSAALLLGMISGASAANAQGIGGPPPPVRSSIDENGVDLGSGQFTVSSVDLVIGQPSSGGLIYVRNFRGASWRDSLAGTIKSVGTTFTVSLGTGSSTFKKVGSTFTSTEMDGASLTLNITTQVYTYTDRSGTVAQFSKTLAEASPLEANEGKIISIKTPSGETLTYFYKTVLISGFNYHRLQSVTNNHGYQIKIEYALNAPINLGQLQQFRSITKVTGLNNAVDYCDPAADVCSFSRTWPYVTFAHPASNTQTVTDASGRVTRYTLDTGGRITGIKRPASAIDTTTIAYNAVDGTVSSVSRGGAQWTYGFSGDGTTLFAHVLDPVWDQSGRTGDSRIEFRCRAEDGPLSCSSIGADRQWIFGRRGDRDPS